VETEFRPRLVGGNTELGCSKLKMGKGFLKPNLERFPSLSAVGGAKLSEKLQFAMYIPSTTASGSQEIDYTGEYAHTPAIYGLACADQCATSQCSLRFFLGHGGGHQAVGRLYRVRGL